MQQMEESAKNKNAESMIENWSVDWQEIGEKFMRKMKEVNKKEEGTEYHFELNKNMPIRKALVTLFNRYVKEHNLSLGLVEKEKEETLVIKKISLKER